MLAPAHDRATPFVGRLGERRLLTSLLDDVAARGQALVLRGEPGIGKSRLLAEAERTARERGMAVLTTAGVQSEAHLPFAGLHQLLRPVRGRASELRDVQRAALDAAFGLTHEAAPEHFRIAMAALDLLSDVAADSALSAGRRGRPLARPADRDRAGVRRAADRVRPDRAARGDPRRLSLRARRSRACRSTTLVGLDDATAAALLDAAAPDLPIGTRTRVLHEAAGNPLAILELPAVVGRHDDEPSVAGGVPLTERLERAFADRVSELPEATRLLLLVAALSDEDRLDEILEASAAVAGDPVDLDAAGPAAEAGIVDADLQTIRFRHPLIRSAIAQSAGLAERRRVHEALADRAPRPAGPARMAPRRAALRRARGRSRSSSRKREPGHAAGARSRSRSPR